MRGGTRNQRGPHPPAFFVRLCVIVLVCAVPGAAWAGDPMSDRFQPDVFGTGAALRERTPGLSDPLALQCPAPKGPLSLAAAVDLALCRSPTMRTAWASAHQQAAALGAAESAQLPVISASGEGSRYIGSHLDITGNVDQQSQSTADAAVSLSWMLYDFGGRSSRTRSARYLLEAAAATVNTTSQQTVFMVVQTYYGAVAADAALDAARVTEDTSRRSLEIARALRTSGVGTVADVLQAETAYDEAVIARVDADRAARAAYGALAVSVGLYADQPLKLEAESVPAQVPELTARMSDLMAEAARQRTDLAAAYAQRDAAEVDVTAARAVGRPTISFTASRNLVSDTGIPQQSYGVVGLGITVPLFSGFSVDYGVRQAQAALQAREVNVEQVRLTVSLDVWTAYYALDSADQELVQTAGLVDTAEKNHEVALSRYRSGVGTMLEVLTAQSAAAAARLRRIIAEHSWQVSRVQLALALGRLSGAEPLSTLSQP